jgi:hypothetical protein
VRGLQPKTYREGEVFLEPVHANAELTFKNRSNKEAATVLLYQVSDAVGEARLLLWI